MIQRQQGVRDVQKAMRRKQLADWGHSDQQLRLGSETSYLAMIADQSWPALDFPATVPSSAV